MIIIIIFDFFFFVSFFSFFFVSNSCIIIHTSPLGSEDLAHGTSATLLGQDFVV